MRSQQLLERDRLSVYDYGTEEPILTPLVSVPLDMQYRAVRADAYGRYVLIGAKKAKRNSLASLLSDITEQTAPPTASADAAQNSVHAKDVTP